MRSALPLLLDESWLPIAELSAARLDGELNPVADRFCPIDVPPSPAIRAEAIRQQSPPGLIAERMTAAWVHGATPRTPLPLQLCVRSSRRVRIQPAPRFEVRQVLLADDELVDAGPMMATSAFRTALDLLRWEQSFPRSTALCVSTLLLAAGATLSECRTRFRRVHHMPHKNRGLLRLAAFDEHGGLRSPMGAPAPLTQPPVTR